MQELLSERSNLVRRTEIGEQRMAVEARDPCRLAEKPLPEGIVKHALEFDGRQDLPVVKVNGPAARR